MTGYPVSPKTRGLPSPVVSQMPVTTGMEYFLSFQPRSFGAPSVPLPTRSSLGQMIQKYRLQDSLYLSRFRLGLQAVIGYPTARGQTILNTAPPLARRPVPTTSGLAAAKPGAMGSPPRFSKALRAPVVPFNPPIYGES